LHTPYVLAHIHSDTTYVSFTSLRTFTATRPRYLSHLRAHPQRHYLSIFNVFAHIHSDTTYVSFTSSPTCLHRTATRPMYLPRTRLVSSTDSIALAATRPMYSPTSTATRPMYLSRLRAHPQRHYLGIFHVFAHIHSDTTYVSFTSSPTCLHCTATRPMYLPRTRLVSSTDSIALAATRPMYSPTSTATRPMYLSRLRAHPQRHYLCIFHLLAYMSSLHSDATHVSSSFSPSQASPASTVLT
jgi:hypothetical protein